MAHTPGPWKHVRITEETGDDWVLAYTDTYYITTDGIHCDQIGDEIDDAHLIASAPALLAENAALRQSLEEGRQWLAEAERHRDELAAALRDGGSEYGSAQTVMEAIADSLEKWGVNGWPNFLRWKAEKERAALARLEAGEPVTQPASITELVEASAELLEYVHGIMTGGDDERELLERVRLALAPFAGREE